MTTFMVLPFKAYPQ